MKGQTRNKSCQEMHMDIYTVTFLGHRTINNMREVEERLDELIRKLLREKYYVDFLVGRNGEFDTMASAAIRRAKQAVGDHNSTFTLVLPYLTAEYKNSEKYFKEYYDEIEVCEESSKAHFKSAIQIRNRHMIDRADLVVCYIDHESGGAFQSVKYARSLNKDIINLAYDERI